MHLAGDACPVVLEEVLHGVVVFRLVELVVAETLHLIEATEEPEGDVYGGVVCGGLLDVEASEVGEASAEDLVERLAVFLIDEQTGEGEERVAELRAFPVETGFEHQLSVGLALGELLCGIDEYALEGVLGRAFFLLACEFGFELFGVGRLK